MRHWLIQRIKMPPLALLAYIVSAGAVGVAVLNNWLALFVPAIVLSYYLFFYTLRASYKRAFVVYGLACLLYMEVLTYWFVYISPSGWLQKIGPLNTKVWLFLVVFVANTFASLLVGGFGLGVRSIFKRLSLSPNSILSVYLFSAWWMLSTLLQATLFSVAVGGNGTPTGPIWGVFSLAPLSQVSLLRDIGAVFGYWGSGFFLVFATTISGITLQRCLKKSFRPIQSWPILLVLGILVSTAYFGKPDKPASAPSLVLAVSSHTEQGDFMPSLLERLAQRDKNNTTIVVLPEYDETIFPNPLTPAILVDTSHRKELEKQDLTNVYFVGTQDAFYKDTRYAQNYLVNDRLEHVQKRSKQFLVPGGEYIIGWVDSIFQRVDPDAALAFKRSRGRYAVDNQALAVEAKPDMAASRVAIGACSSTLYPAGFRNDVKAGAEMIAINISYQQFANTRQYSEFANRNMAFMAHAYRRPIIAGVSYGKAKIFQPSGTTYQQRDYGAVSEVYLQGESLSRTLYTVMGDTGIIGLVTALAVLLVWLRYRKLRPAHKPIKSAANQ